MPTVDASGNEGVEAFRARARAWLAETIPRFGASDEDLLFGGEGGAVAQRRATRGKALQRALFDGGFAGITFPTEYSGRGLTVAHRDAFNAEVRAAGDEAVALFNLGGSLWGLSIGMIAPTMIEFGTEEQKRTYIPEMLRGEKLWAQMLSEPTGGSDLAGAITRATRDGDQYLINGSKVWTSQADVSDMAVLLARTNWDVPKHRGLSMFIISLDLPGLTINPLRLVSGGTGFCQEFFDDMAVPVSSVLGGVDDGWNVASRLLVHERNTVGGGSTFHTMSISAGRRGSARSPLNPSMVELTKQTGHSTDDDLRQQSVETHVLSTVSGHLASRVVQGMAKGVMPPAAGSILRLFGSAVGLRSSDVGMAVAGVNAVIWPADRSAPGSGMGLGFLGRQGGSMASGTAEIQRNIISERVLGLPREPAPDRDLPFSQVRHNAMPGPLTRKQS
jgi:alkylation response protein AidB-like acyl-CoA dehydrogenase